MNSTHEQMKIVALLVFSFVCIQLVSCSVADSEVSQTREYLIAVSSKSELPLDSIEVSVSVNGVESVDTTFYSVALALDSQQDRIEHLQIFDATTGVTMYQDTIQFDVRGSIGDSMVVEYWCYSKGFLLLEKRKAFLFEKSPFKTTEEINQKAIEIARLISVVEKTVASPDARNEEYKKIMVEKMCTYMNTNEYYLLFKERSQISPSAEDSVLNLVMDCMFDKTLYAASLNGVNKNIPSSINVDSVFKERFYSGKYKYQNYIESPLGALVPESAVIDSIKKVRGL